MALTLVSCSKPETPLLVVSMPGCNYAGPNVVEAGPVTLNFTLNGLGSHELLVLRLEDDRQRSDVSDFVDDSGDTWLGPPDWASQVAVLQIEGGAEDSTTELPELKSGLHALVCLDGRADRVSHAALGGVVEVRADT